MVRVVGHAQHPGECATAAPAITGRAEQPVVINRIALIAGAHPGEIEVLERVRVIVMPAESRI
jgi:hypothetical protein